MEETTVSIPDDIKRSLKVSAKRLRVTEAQIIREALAAYVAVEPPELPSGFGSESDGTVISENSQEWLAENWKPDW